MFSEVVWSNILNGIGNYDYYSLCSKELASFLLLDVWSNISFTHLSYFPIKYIFYYFYLLFLISPHLYLRLYLLGKGSDAFLGISLYCKSKFII